MGRASGRNENHHDGRSDYMPGPRTKMDNTSGGWNIKKKQECWEGHEKALITTIRKETKRTEELEEAGYRSPTWAVLRALQQINNAARIEGEAAMSTPVSFKSAGRGDLLCWGGKEGPTVVIWESLSEQEKENWLEEASTMHDWVVWCKSKKKRRRKSAHLGAAGKKSSLNMMKPNRKKKGTKRTGAKRRHTAGRAYDTGHGGSKATSKWK